jgi:hypothetical protein
MGEDVHLGRFDGPHEALGLIAISVKVTVDRCHHTVHFEAFAFRHVKGAVLQDLDLEPLEKAMVVAVLVIPPINPSPLKPNTLGIETRGDLETARVIGHH